MINFLVHKAIFSNSYSFFYPKYYKLIVFIVIQKNKHTDGVKKVISSVASITLQIVVV